ncbi:MAG: sensor histidine kinase [Chloroflexota bacterium]|nr:sensor histidine kinase [Chloroflexota bacterium]MDE3192374.1 sensor histidine kinase [Chloroflexota bacterium]
MRWPRALASQLLLLQIAIVATTVALGTLVSLWLVSQQVDAEYEQRSLAIAHAVASTPDILEAYGTADPARVIQPIAEAIRKSSGASFVVVTDAGGIRYSHPNPAEIGKRVSTDPSEALSGRDYVGIQQGTLGLSVRGKTPVRAADGSVIGEVSVGFLVPKVQETLSGSLPLLLANFLLALALGVVGSLLLARRLKRQTLGLEPSQIAALVEEREAVLHGIREGVVATDLAGRITLVNDEARRLLSLDASCVGQRVESVIPAGAMRDVLTGARPGTDEVVLSSERVLVVNRMPAAVRGETIGAVATLRDRTEIEGALQQLHTERTLAHALRTQAHEFYNKLHAVSGLIELGRTDEAVGLISSTALVHQELVDTVRGRIGDPTLAALLLAKASVASERGVDFRLAGDARLAGEAVDPRDLITVVGNLVDNAIDAAAGTPGAWIEVGLADGPGSVEIRVRDSGPGISPAHASDIWDEGFTTKRGVAHHGLGLALVRQITERRGGSVRMNTEGATEFAVVLPTGVLAR